MSVYAVSQIISEELCTLRFGVQSEVTSLLRLVFPDLGVLILGYLSVISIGYCYYYMLLVIL